MILRKCSVRTERERLLIPINMRDGSLLCIGKEIRTGTFGPARSRTPDVAHYGNGRYAA